MLWASKIKVINILGDGFLKTKNQRRTQVSNNAYSGYKKWVIFEVFFSKNFDSFFLPLIFSFS